MCLVCETHLCSCAWHFILSNPLVNSELPYSIHVIWIPFVWAVISSTIGHLDFEFYNMNPLFWNILIDCLCILPCRNTLCSFPKFEYQLSQALPNTGHRWSCRSQTSLRAKGHTIEEHHTQNFISCAKCWVKHCRAYCVKVGCMGRCVGSVSEFCLWLESHP